MIGLLEQFSIYDLWGEKEVHLKFHNNKLILVGENGSGKTTILRIVYETLACKWTMLSVEDFSKIELSFSKGKPITILKAKIQDAKELFVDSDSTIFRELPPVIRRSLIEQSNISGRDISYDQIIETLTEYGYTDREFTARLKEKMNAIEKKTLSEYSRSIKERLGCSVIYLPTYRRVEKRIGYVNERDYPRRRSGYSYRMATRSISEDQSIEIAKTGMDDVEYFIQLSLDEIHRKADISASRLNYQCFKGILNKVSDNVSYNEEILSEEEIEKVFGSINEDVLSPAESSQIQLLLKKMKSAEAPQQQTYDQIVYYFYSMLHERYLNIKENEKVILTFFDACNAYLGNKKFVYNEKKYTYDICIIEGSKTRNINLEDLSSGEKQVVSVFSYLYLSPLSKSIILIDEPELSLSVPWQKKFLLDISRGNQCAGLISVTHSPFVFDNELKPFAHSLEEFIQ